MPYCDALKNFIRIPLKSFCAMNKQKMSAVGMGEMTIDVPNSTDVSKLMLTEVLYSLNVGYTLVSVRKLDDKGFELTFSGGRCTICGPIGEHIGAIPKARQGLYHVAHEEPISVNSAKEILTLDQFHCQMRHISLGIAHCLVEKGFVTGVHLEPMLSGDSVFCESCVYAKATRKSVPKAWEGKHTKMFGK